MAGRLGLRNSQDVAAVDAKPMPFNCSVLLAEAGTFHVVVLSSNLEVQFSTLAFCFAVEFLSC